MQAVTWILVSDASRAKLFEVQQGRLRELEDLIHPESALHADDLITDHRGRKGKGEAARPGLSATNEAKENEAERFARQGARRLLEGLDAHRYESLLLVAPPHHLGLLRRFLDPQVGRRVSASFHRDYINLPPEELRRRLGELLDLQASKVAPRGK